MIATPCQSCIGLISLISPISHISPILPITPIAPIITFFNHSCPDSTISTTRSVSRSVFSGSYFFVRLAPNAQAKA